MPPHKMYYIKITVIGPFIYCLIHQRKQLPIYNSVILSGITNLSKLMNLAVICQQLSKITPDTRAFLIG